MNGYVYAYGRRVVDVLEYNHCRRMARVVLSGGMTVWVKNKHCWLR